MGAWEYHTHPNGHQGLCLGSATALCWHRGSPFNLGAPQHLWDLLCQQLANPTQETSSNWPTQVASSAVAGEMVSLPLPPWR